MLMMTSFPSHSLLIPFCVLREQIRNYFMQQHVHEKHYDSQNILKLLSPVLRWCGDDVVMRWWIDSFITTSTSSRHHTHLLTIFVFFSHHLIFSHFITSPHHLLSFSQGAHSWSSPPRMDGQHHVPQECHQQDLHLLPVPQDWRRHVRTPRTCDSLPRAGRLYVHCSGVIMV